MKKFIYIFGWVVLGLLLASIAHAISEMWYISHLIGLGTAPVDYGAFGTVGHYCALPVWYQYLLVDIGLIGGFFAGKYFYRVIYERNFLDFMKRLFC